MQRLLREHPLKWKRHLKRAAAIRSKTNVSKYSKAEQVINGVMIGAKQRCTNPNGVAWENYGGRGIEFRFVSIEIATRWVHANLGPKPKGRYSIDRIDNNRHYEPGNLRWATYLEQARNKGRYRRTDEGERLRKLVMIRTDYSEEGLRRYVKLGWTNEQIIGMKKPPGGRKKKNAQGRL